MYIGYNMNCFQIERKMTPVHCLYLLPIGLLAAYHNNVEFVSMDSVIYGNVPLMLIGSLCISLSIHIFVYYFIPQNPFLEYLGKNTIPILGFNYLINYFIDWANELLCIFEQVNWQTQFILDIVLILPIISLWNHFYSKSNGQQNTSL